MKALKRTTGVYLIVEYLRKLDDFATVQQIHDALPLLPDSPQGKAYQVSSTLAHLREVKVVDVMEVAGELYWYALPPEGDLRTCTHEERAHEKGPRQRRRKS